MFDKQKILKMQADLLSCALPYIQKYEKTTIVIKYGGHAITDLASRHIFASDIDMLKQLGIHPVIIHGGGPQITNMCEKMGIKPHFESGIRISDEDVVKVAEMVLCGSINKNIVSLINQEGQKAIGLSGKDANLALVQKMPLKVIYENGQKKEIDLGYVGEVSKVNKEIIEILNQDNFIPVIAPIATDEAGITYNVNADIFAGAIASALQAKRLLFLTDVPGVLDKDGKHISKLTVKTALDFIKDGTITGGMIPKVETCIQALSKGVEAVAIVDGRAPHQILLELFTEKGAGTLIEK